MPRLKPCSLHLIPTLLMGTLSFSAGVLSQPLIKTEDLLLTTRAPAHYPCAECHALDGNPGMTAEYNKQSPKLAGQSAAYLFKQLKLFQSGQRYTDEMAEVIAVYSDDELRRIADHYSQQKTKNNQPYAAAFDTLKRSHETNQQWVKEGQTLYLKGDKARDISACQSCHTKNLSSNRSDIPIIQGQYARYIRSTLTAYKTSQRQTDSDVNKAMQKISQGLTEHDINAVAAYLERQ